MYAYLSGFSLIGVFIVDSEGRRDQPKAAFHLNLYIHGILLLFSINPILWKCLIYHDGWLDNT